MPKTHEELTAKQRSRYYCKRNMAFKFTQNKIEPYVLPYLEKC